MEKNADKKPVKQVFREVVNEYDDLFHKQFGLDPTQSWWAGSEIGTVLLFCNGDYSLGFEDIRYIVDQNIQWEEFKEWWETNLDYADSSDTFAVNLRSWHHGYRPDRSKTATSVNHRFFVHYSDLSSYAQYQFLGTMPLGYGELG